MLNKYRPGAPMNVMVTDARSSPMTAPISPVATAACDIPGARRIATRNRRRA